MLVIIRSCSMTLVHVVLATLTSVHCLFNPLEVCSQWFTGLVSDPHLLRIMQHVWSSVCVSILWWRWVSLLFSWLSHCWCRKFARSWTETPHIKGVTLPISRHPLLSRSQNCRGGLITRSACCSVEWWSIRCACPGNMCLIASSLNPLGIVWLPRYVKVSMTSSVLPMAFESSWLGGQSMVV